MVACRFFSGRRKNNINRRSVVRIQSVISNDADHHVTMAYTMNRMASGIIGGDTSTALLSCAYQLLR